jgi:galactokinase
VSGNFAATFGYAPEGIWAAPGRLNIIGEFTDYNGGHVLPIALESVTRAFLARREDDLCRVASASSPASGDPLVATRLSDLAARGDGFWADYAVGVIWAFADAGYPVTGLDIFFDSEVPIGAGLSSSAALECSIALALGELVAPDLSRRQLALLAQRAENAFVGVPSGIMDQTASLCCTEGNALLFDTRDGVIEQIPFDLAASGFGLVVIDTGVRRHLAQSAYANRRAACERAAALLGLSALRDATLSDLVRIADEEIRRRARHIVTEEARVLETAALLRVGEIAAVGPVLSAGHRSLRDDFEVTGPELDLAVDAAVAAGALGARMIGGGFGGCAIALAHRGDLDTVSAGVTAAFAAAGFGSPTIFFATPAPGARRLS